jgi:hypothetical protein
MIDITLIEFAQAFFFGVPFIFAGLIHIAVIKYNLLQQLAGLPLDCGLKLRGKRIFGKNKTVRGVVTMIAGVTILTLLQAVVVRRFSFAAELMLVDYNRVSPLMWGLLLGAGCVVGELPNSFIKRQLNIEPGDQAPVSLKPIFWLIDQVDSLISMLLFASIVWKPNLDIVISMFIIALIIHPLGTLIMVSLRLKRSL